MDNFIEIPSKWVDDHYNEHIPITCNCANYYNRIFKSFIIFNETIYIDTKSKIEWTIGYNNDKFIIFELIGINTPTDFESIYIKINIIMINRKYLYWYELIEQICEILVKFNGLYQKKEKLISWMIKLGISENEILTKINEMYKKHSELIKEIESMETRIIDFKDLYEKKNYQFVKNCNVSFIPIRLHPLFIALSNGDFHIAKSLINNGLNINKVFDNKDKHLIFFLDQFPKNNLGKIWDFFIENRLDINITFDNLNIFQYYIIEDKIDIFFTKYNIELSEWFKKLVKIDKKNNSKMIKSINEDGLNGLYLYTLYCLHSLESKEKWELMIEYLINQYGVDIINVPIVLRDKYYDFFDFKNKLLEEANETETIWLSD